MSQHLAEVAQSSGNLLLTAIYWNIHPLKLLFIFFTIDRNISRISMFVSRFSLFSPASMMGDAVYGTP